MKCFVLNLSHLIPHKKNQVHKCLEELKCPGNKQLRNSYYTNLDLIEFNHEMLFLNGFRKGVAFQPLKKDNSRWETVGQQRQDMT